MSEILVETRGAIGVITIARPEKRNAFTLEMLRSLSQGFDALESNDTVRALVVHAEGGDFTTGLDLMDVAPSFAQGIRPFPETALDPWDVIGRARKKPLVTAVHGRCYTLGLELALAADSCVAAHDTVFSFREVCLGIIPLGGGVVRMLEAVGWSATMRYALTGDDLSALEAERLHIVQDLVEPGTQFASAFARAERIAAQPPLAARALLEHAREALELGRRAALAHVPARARALLQTEDTREAALSLRERRVGTFHGR